MNIDVLVPPQQVCPTLVTGKSMMAIVYVNTNSHAVLGDLPHSITMTCISVYYNGMYLS